MQDSKGVAFVTGAAGGMGRAIGAALVKRGSRVVLVDRNADGIRKLAEELGPGTYPLELDITDAGQVDSCLERLPAEFSPIEILVNNAGHDIGGRKRFDISAPPMTGRRSSRPT